MKKQQVHLSWGCICLAMVGLTYGLTGVEESRNGPAERPAVRFLSPRANATPRTPPALAAPPNSGTQATLAPVLAASERRSAPARVDLAAGNLAAGPAVAPSAAPNQLKGPRPVAPAPVAITLDPDAEALIRSLFRLRREEDYEQQEYVTEAVSSIMNGLTDPQKYQLILALTAYAPRQDLWQSHVGGTVSDELVAIRSSAYDRAPTDENLESLLGLLNYQSAKELDSRLVERLLRSHPDNRILQSLFAQSSPERAAEVFGRNGLSEYERRLLVGVVAREDVVKAAALSLELFAEERSVDDLVTAMEYDPRAVEAFLQQREGDPIWRELATMARLQMSYGSDETRDSARIFATSWEQLSPENLVDALEISLDYSESWTPFQSKALTRIVATGNAELVGRVLELAPTRERWKVLVGTNYKIEPGDDSNLEAERYAEFLDDEPFAARGMLQTFFQVYPVLEPQDALMIAQSFQSKGDAETAKEVLGRSRMTTFIKKAKRHLADGLSLEELDVDDEEEE
ncbi:MAG: hypothetical protein JKY65_03460 [Planctomycetes bacterium]|nr:hypothetical protein [Planctomycetota bacterium]